MRLVRTKIQSYSEPFDPQTIPVTWPGVVSLNIRVYSAQREPSTSTTDVFPEMRVMGHSFVISSANEYLIVVKR